MSLNRICSIDLDKLWQEQMDLTSNKGEGVEYWNRMASRFSRSPSGSDDYTRELMARMELAPSLTVLDVGCGAGAMIVPLAEHVRSVTALDLSPVMLQQLERNLLASKINNVRPVVADFLTVNPVELGNYDIVLASRSLPMGNLRKALNMMNSLSRGQCYLTWMAGCSDDDAMISDFLGVKYYPYPDYLIIANILYTMNIRANIEIYSATGEHLFNNINDGIIYALHGRKADDQQLKYLGTCLKDRFSFQEGLWHFCQTNRWALIWWKK